MWSYFGNDSPSKADILNFGLAIDGLDKLQKFNWNLCPLNKKISKMFCSNLMKKKNLINIFFNPSSRDIFSIRILSPLFGKVSKLRLSLKDMQYNEMIDLYKALENRPNLKILDLCYSNINETHVQILVNILEKQVNLEKFYFSSNQIGDFGMELLSPCLAKHSQLKVLDLSFIEFSKFFNFTKQTTQEIVNYAIEIVLGAPIIISTNLINLYFFNSNNFLLT